MKPWQWGMAAGAALLSAAAAAQHAQGQLASYEGHYICGSETNCFMPLQGGEAWSIEGNLDGLRPFIDSSCDPYAPMPFGPAYVKLLGRLSPEGRYGHLGGYRRQLAVERIVELRIPTAASQREQARREEAKGNFRQAVAIYRRLARQGDRDAALTLAEIYESGRPGVARDLSESLAWRQRSRQSSPKGPPRQ